MDDDLVPLSLPAYSSTRVRGMYWNYSLGLKRGFHHQAADPQRVRDVVGFFTALYSEYCDL